MNFSTTNDSLGAISSDFLAVVVPKNDIAGALSGLNADFVTNLVTAAAADDFEGKVGTWRSYPTFGNAAASRVVLIGSGKNDREGRTRAAGRFGDLCRRFSVENAHLAIDIGNDLEAIAAAIAEGNYRFDRYQAEDDRKPTLEHVVLLGAAQPDVDRLAAIAAGQNLTRDLVNEPAGVIYPETLADVAVGLQGENLTVTVWDEHKIAAEGMGGIIAVGQGSDRPQRFVHMHYKPAGTPRKKICFVGKGVTFDAGGLSLKPSAGMQTMRCDMGGSAVVIGAMRAIKQLQPDVEVHGIFGAVENMVSGNSYKLGDVLKMYSGKTVEIHNTDAEGRLVLADCLHYAAQLDVDVVVDLATLTGACVVALGEEYSGLFSSHDDVAKQLLEAANAANERVWRMPLPDSYKEKLKAEWGEIKNVGGRWGGAITAALFLKEFVGDKPWAHLDIAGPTFTEKSWRHLSAGGTGAMVRTLVAWTEA